MAERIGGPCPRCGQQGVAGCCPEPPMAELSPLEKRAKRWLESNFPDFEWPISLIPSLAAEIEAALAPVIEQRDEALAAQDLNGEAISEARAYLSEHLGHECARAFFDDCIHNAVAIALNAKNRCRELESALELARGHSCWAHLACKQCDEINRIIIAALSSGGDGAGNESEKAKPEGAAGPSASPEPSVTHGSPAPPPTERLVKVREAIAALCVAVDALET